MAEKGEERRIVALIEQLGDAEYATRSSAQQELVAAGNRDPQGVIAAAVLQYRKSGDPEVRQRLKEVLQRLVGEHIFQADEAHLGIIVRPTEHPVRIEDRLIRPLKVRLLLDSPPGDPGSLQVGDQLVQVDDIWLDPALSFADLHHYIRTRKPGQSISFTVLEGGKLISREAVVGKLPKAPDEVDTQALRQQFFRRWLRGKLRTEEPTAAQTTAR